MVIRHKKNVSNFIVVSNSFIHMSYSHSSDDVIFFMQNIKPRFQTSIVPKKNYLNDALVSKLNDTFQIGILIRIACNL